LSCESASPTRFLRDEFALAIIINIGPCRETKYYEITTTFIASLRVLSEIYINITTPKQFEPSLCWVLICISNIFCEWETKEESQIDVE
jgi:hypothetical protein